MSYSVVNSCGVQYIKFNILDDIPFVKHGFSTRIGGISKGEYNSLNVGLNTGDIKDDAEANIKIFASAVGVNYEDLVLSDQIHSDIVKSVYTKDKGKGYMIERDYNGIDALVTNEKGIPLMTIFADCVPIFFVDPIKKVIGLAHAGWKGTMLQIGKRTVEAMNEKYGSKMDEILAVIGPSIGKCCYEVDNVVVEKFNEKYSDPLAFVLPKGENKYMLDLWKANKIGLLEAGLLDENITISNLCTSCNTDMFYSYRKEKGNTGRMGAILEIV